MSKSSRSLLQRPVVPPHCLRLRAYLVKGGRALVAGLSVLSVLGVLGVLGVLTFALAQRHRVAVN